jgi:hypothetical protein
VEVHGWLSARLQISLINQLEILFSLGSELMQLEDLI